MSIINNIKGIPHNLGGGGRGGLSINQVVMLNYLHLFEMRKKRLKLLSWDEEELSSQNKLQPRYSSHCKENIWDETKSNPASLNWKWRLCFDCFIVFSEGLLISQPMLFIYTPSRMRPAKFTVEVHRSACFLSQAGQLCLTMPCHASTSVR